LPELVTEPPSLVVAVVDATGETSDPPHAASATTPPNATTARNREVVCMKSSCYCSLGFAARRPAAAGRARSLRPGRDRERSKTEANRGAAEPRTEDALGQQLAGAPGESA